MVVDIIIDMLEKRYLNSNTECNTNDGLSENDYSKSCEQKKNDGQFESLEDLILFLRSYRMGLIQTSQQLRFSWLAIFDWILKQNHTQTSVECDPVNNCSEGDRCCNSPKSWSPYVVDII